VQGFLIGKPQVIAHYRAITGVASAEPPSGEPASDRKAASPSDRRSDRVRRARKHRETASFASRPRR
jgi:hypothetical protein